MGKKKKPRNTAGSLWYQLSGSGAFFHNAGDARCYYLFFQQENLCREGRKCKAGAG